MQPHDDFAFEDRPGIPAPLPPGERVLWQGSPDWRTLARGTFHVVKVAVWFVALAAFELVWTLARGEALAPAVPGIVRTLALGGVAVAILGSLAWLTGRVTIYTITERRLLIRFGIALQITMNLPFVEVSAAGLRVDAGGTGDIPLALRDARRVGYLVLWPHVRPWRFAAPEPMLRAVPDAERVAGLLAEAMRTAERTRTHAAPEPVASVPRATGERRAPATPDVAAVTETGTAAATPLAARVRRAPAVAELS